METMQQLTQALQMHQAGQLAQAEMAYRQILEQGSADVNAYYLLGLACYEQGKLSEALSILQQALEMNMETPECYNSLGNVLTDLGQYEEAISHYQKAISLAHPLGQRSDEFHVNLGIAHQYLNQVALAEQAYRTALEINPHGAEAWCNLGNLYRCQGETETAVDAYGKAIALDSTLGDAHYNLASLLAAKHDYEVARVHILQAIQYQPQLVQAKLLAGRIYHELGDRDAAIPWFLQHLKQLPGNAAATQCLATLYYELEEFDTALDYFRPLLQNMSLAPDTRFLYARCLKSANQPQEAISQYLQVVESAPESAPEVLLNAYFEASVLWQQMGKTAEAIELLHQAITLHPDFSRGHEMLGMLHNQTRNIRKAIKHYEAALQLNPPSQHQVHYNLGTLYWKSNEPLQAIAHYKSALELNPAYHEAIHALAYSYLQTNQAQQAIQCIQAGYQQTQQDALLLKQAMILPAIYQTQEEIMQWRRQQKECLATITQKESLKMVNPVQEIGITNFYLSYQGLNDIEHQRAFAAIFQKFSQQWTRHITPPVQITRKKPRIGFISQFFQKQHTIAKLTQGLLDHLSREQFEVVLFLSNDSLTQQEPIEHQPNDTIVWLDFFSLLQMQESIAAAELDILFYTDIGMNPLTYFLAFSRLAPIQCTTWGHPVTTGISTIDYFISSHGVDTHESQAYYSEKLQIFDHLSTYYYRPVMPQGAKTRQDYGFSDTDHLYICAQSLFKIHPDFDLILKGILEQDPLAKIAFLQGPTLLLGEVLQARWKRVMPDETHRLVILDRLSPQEFIPFQAMADVLLDPTHFAGGSTSLEAFAFGIPIVTMPSPYARSRITYACYLQMNVLDCVAHNHSHYIEIAVRLGTDADYRRHVQDKIKAANHVLYENPSVISEFEQFFLEAIEHYNQQKFNTIGTSQFALEDTPHG